MMNRREALARLGALFGGGLMAPSLLRAEQTTGTVTGAAVGSTAAKSGAPLTIAHITDTHITNEYASEKWVAHCLNRIQAHPAKPTMILHTGDIIMDSVHTPLPRVEEYWKIWNATAKNELSLPIHYAIGNHDVWGTRYIKADADKLRPAEPLFGKGLVKERLGLPKLYTSVDAGSWQVIMLDSINPFSNVRPDGTYDWIAKIDDEQRAWLTKELAEIPSDKPVLICSHIPILQITTMASQKPQEETGSYLLGPKDMMTDARQFVDLFRKHPNVKLCLSGHTHYQSLVKLNEATYFNAGSVCGAQWRHMDMDPARPGFTIVKLYPDGRFEYEYEAYGWKPTAEVKAA